MDITADTINNVSRDTHGRLNLLTSALEHAHDGIIITDVNEKIVEINPSFTEITGYSPEDILGQTPRILKSGYQDSSYYAAMWKTLHDKGYWRGEVWNRKKTGEVYPEILTISAVYGAQNEITHYIGIFTDITILKEHQRYLERIAHYDALTQLPNRTLLLDRLQQAMAHAQRNSSMLAVCYLDLDGFKPINDHYGHAAGDRLLLKVAVRLKEDLRDGDTIARLGGDEFALLLGDITTVHQCEQLLQRMLQTLAKPYDIDDSRKATVSASIGVTLFPADNDNPDVLLRHADQAMYIAKQAGRNRYHLFDPDLDRQARANLEARSQIEVALDAAEFVLYFQPKVDMRRGKVVGAETLIRWIHPERGLLPPAEFLPVVEGTDLAIRIGDWVLHRALQYMTEWKRRGYELVVSVNIFGRQLQQTDFPGHIEQLLKCYDEVNPRQLILEVLETTALNDIATVSDVIERCQTLGVSFSLDDFGTGYSSLTYLKRLPANELKIDQSFVREILYDSDDLAIVEGIIGLSQAFQRQVVAEGVETVEHGVMLLHLGCDLAQGYGIARPMPADEFLSWIAAYKPQQRWLDENNSYWSRDDLPLLTAGLEHSRWVNDLVSKFQDTCDTTILLPPLDPHECRFGKWYDGPGHIRYGHLADFTTLELLHDRVHNLAHELVALHETGKLIELRRRLPELLKLRDIMLQHLNRLRDRIAEENVTINSERR